MNRRLVLMVVFGLVLLIGLSRVDLTGGIILGEPDEFVHVQVVESLLTKGWPSYQGVGFYYEMPGYFWAGRAFSLFFHNHLWALRFVSFISLILSGFLIFYYLKAKEGIGSAVAGAILFFLIPLTVFYLRVAIIEPFLVMSLLGTVVFFDLGWRRRETKHLFVSGLFLGLGFLTKYSILPVFLAILIFFLIKLVRDNRRFWENRFLFLDRKLFLTLLTAAAIFLPIFMFFYARDPLHVKWQTKQIFGLTGEVHQELRLERLLDFPWWFSGPVVILSALGFIRLLKNYRNYSFIILCFALLLGSVLTRLPFYPRYALVLAPFLAIFGVQALALIKETKWRLVILVLVAVLNLSSLASAYGSASQNLLERSTAEAARRAFEPAWVFSNFWPNYFAAALGKSKFSWVTLSVADIDGFARGEKRDTLEILKEEGGAVFLERTFADLYLTQSSSRLKALSDLQDSYRPSFSLEDQRSNFPFLRQRGNRLDVYLIAPERK